MSKGQRTPGGKQRWQCRGSTGDRSHCYSTTDPKARVARDQGGRATGKAQVFKRKLKQGPVKRYIITAAQNATPVHRAFEAMRVYAKAVGAELIVIPLRYKNATSAWTASQANAEWWDPVTRPYLYNARHRINENLILLADIRTQPTASSPLTGFESITASESGILGHTKLQLKTIAAPSSKMPKLLTTTGACTVPNYTDSKAGKLGEFHHTLGAVIVETRGKTFHMRHINCNKSDGSFTDLDWLYRTDSRYPAPQPEALIMGDTHVDFIDPLVKAATFHPIRGMVAQLKPKRLVWHDLLDGYSVNPHHEGNPFTAYAKQQAGMDDAKAEVERAIAFVVARTSADCKSFIISSNHDDFLRRWVHRHDWRSDPMNAEFYLETALHMLRATKMGEGGSETPSPFAYWVDQWGGNHVKAVGTNEAFSVAGIELSMHGDRGPNGSRGSIHNLRRIGVKSVIGHSHTPGIDEGCYQVGTSTKLRLEYNSGPSSWLNAHCVLHADGKRQLIFIINGEWRI